MKPVYTTPILILSLFLMEGTRAQQNYSEVIDVAPGAVNLGAILGSAQDGALVRIPAGIYRNVNKFRTGDITVVGIPFEMSGNEADIDSVVIQFGAGADNWTALGKTTIRGIKFEDGDHQIVADDEVLIEYCIFQGGVDQVSFNKTGYGEVANCQFYQAGDDGLDMDSNATAPGAYFNIHHNHFEDTNQDGIEFRTYERKRDPDLMVVEFHHNTFINCGTEFEKGGDAIQIIDQEQNGANSRNILIYNNLIDGQGITHNGIGTNRKNSDAQLDSVGGDLLEEPMWIWNNTIIGVKSAGIAGGNRAYAFNNIVVDAALGYVRCNVQNCLTYNVVQDLGAASINDGGNSFGRDPQLNLSTLAPLANSFIVDSGLISYTADGLTINPDFLGSAPDLGALEAADDGLSGTPPMFNGNLVVKSMATVGLEYGDNLEFDAYDADGDPMSYSVISGPIWLTMSSDGTLSGRPTSADIGLNRWAIRVTAQDGADNATMLIEVRDNIVEPLVAEAGADQTLLAAFEETTVSVSLNATGSTGDIVSYLWLENGIGFASGAAIEFDFEIGTHVVTLLVTDENGDTAQDTVIVTVEASEPPDANNTAPFFAKKMILSTRARIDRLMEKDISHKAREVDEDSLAWSIDGPAWLNISGDGFLYGTPTQSDRGRNLFTVTINDGRGGTATATLKIRVR